MHDYPDTTKFLAPSQRNAVIRRLDEDAVYLSDQLELEFVKQALMDWKIWVHMAITVGICIPLYSIGKFLPAVLEDLGYSDSHALLMAVPPHAVACLLVVGGGFAADRRRQRGIFIIGFCLLAYVPNSFVLFGC